MDVERLDPTTAGGPSGAGPPAEQYAFEIDSELGVENSLHEVDVPAAALAEFRAGLVEEARLCRERERKVEQLNRTPLEPRRRRRHTLRR